MRDFVLCLFLQTSNHFLSVNQQEHLYRSLILTRGINGPAEAVVNVMLEKLSSGLICLATEAKLCPAGPPASFLQSSYLISDTLTVAETDNFAMSVYGC